MLNGKSATDRIESLPVGNGLKITALYGQKLDITRVRGHHFFSAKDCPQPMLENDMEIWWEFIDMVKAEYAKIQLGEGYTFAFECDSDLVNDKGRVTGQDLTSQVVTYKVTVTKDGKTQTVELASIISGSYNK